VLIKLEDDSRNENRFVSFFSSDAIDNTLYPRLEIVYERDVFTPMFKADMFAYPHSGFAPLKVRFDATSSYSPSGIRTYSWDFDSLSANNEDTTGAVVSHIFTEPRDYIVTLIKYR
jgi:PKD repeat protein